MTIQLNSKAFQSYLLQKYDQKCEEKKAEHKSNYGWFWSQIIPMDTRYDARFNFDGFKQCWKDFCNQNNVCQTISDADLGKAFTCIDSPDKKIFHKPDGHFKDNFLSRKEIEDMDTDES
ncbi:MAG: hypothetical protein QE263_07235 [Vampirovibrionales bacterium]|nr:hypothetical protein [Vampirovibrionales bacterium]